MSEAIRACVNGLGAAVVACALAACTAPSREAATSAPPRPAADAVDDAGTMVDDADRSDATVQEAALRPATEAAPEPPAAEPTPRGLLVRLDRVAFAPNSAVLQSGDAQLAGLAELLERYPDRNVVIEGHTDATGNPTANLHLSLKRAEAVQEFLLQRGVDGRRLILRGYGDRYPITGNDTPEQQRRNRRVDVVILEAGESRARPPAAAGEPQAR